MRRLCDGILKKKRNRRNDLSSFVEPEQLHTQSLINLITVLAYNGVYLSLLLVKEGFSFTIASMIDFHTAVLDF